jgi:hypothetical protein
VAGGCVGCHRSGPDTVERGAGHGFRASPAACTSCHASPPPPSDLAARARRLWEAWAGQGGSASDVATGARPPHATRAAIDRSTPRGRAAWDVLLVLEDPAAAAHNAPYARVLLGAAERVITARRR